MTYNICIDALCATYKKITLAIDIVVIIFVVFPAFVGFPYLLEKRLQTMRKFWL